MNLKTKFITVALLGLLFSFSSVSFIPVNASTPSKAGSDLPFGSDAPSGRQTFQFQAEVNRMMDILIHSLYSNKDIFLRELISNASDALDKIRFLFLTDKTVLGDDDVSSLNIRVTIDKENNILTLRDNGIGMTRDELIKNLGTIAKSGTSAFLEQLQKGGDVNLIGQFGVGFYSVYLVADRVEVVSKHNSDERQWIWSSDAQGVFSVEEDSNGAALDRGTEIRVHLKPEASEYTDPEKLRQIVQRYSQFVNFPIYLWEEKVEGEAGGQHKDVGASGEEEDEDVDSSSAATTADVVHGEWSLLSSNKALWLRSPSEISETEYHEFYTAISASAGQDDSPLTYAHFSAEGDVEFRALLYIPEQAPYNYYEQYYTARQSRAKDSQKKVNTAGADGVRLYVRRVFIADDAAGEGEGSLLPRYLSFVRGIVDSDSLPVNVSREMLQQESALKTIRKKVVRKILDLLRKLADDEEACRTRGAKKHDDEDESSSTPPDENACGKYKTFWKAFGQSVKLGVLEDTANRNRLMKLLRFASSHSVSSSSSGDSGANGNAKFQTVSLADYVARMKKGQKHIYFATGSNVQQIQESPFLEALLEKGYEVLFFTDVMDEYIVMNVPEFEGFLFQDASREGLNFGDEESGEGGEGGEEKDKGKKKNKDKKGKGKKEEKGEKESDDVSSSATAAAAANMKTFLKWWKDTLIAQGVKIQAVKTSKRLAKSPCIVVSGRAGPSANMDRILKVQAMKSQSTSPPPVSRILEVNPKHDLIAKLKEKYDSIVTEGGRAGSDSEEEEETLKVLERSARLIFDTALLESGFEIEDMRDFSARMYDSLRSQVEGITESASDEEGGGERKEEQEEKDEGKEHDEL